MSEQPCVVCDNEGEAIHEFVQGQWFTAVRLCEDCHTGERNGWHGRRFMWKLKKMDELKAINETYRRLYREKRL